ncbi:hypothetical protein EN745_12640 [Mesorhizobium sp. M4A.F.Ca.ET.022.05.2.1]|uniref:peroxidase family protein n=1 Tax=Mesorhizobium sp. M4A.F.Ca.ET.022.05.2.1 TaxID=2496653 RepID=UPI000FCA0949|nr:peroxidase family protein [Mesorhizobium sp. M4A.F.Ca.ET.022.05.2.1]RVC80520.1 hypothetical protein EN745_12640 [Mesorhizobium sp. M4A.F.Ca.ET.022.05.2.1]
MARHAQKAYLVSANDRILLFERRKTPKEVGHEEFLTLVRGANTPTYKHIFGWHDGKALPPIKALAALGEALIHKPYASSDDSDIPAGYTYFGQFIFHDISFMGPGKDPPNDRTPALDLDSVLRIDAAVMPGTGCHDSGPLPIGCTSGSVVMAEDLPRVDLELPEEGKPLIVDSRNDDFLPLAQCHVALLKFFNAIAKREGYDPAKKGSYDKVWWQKVRRIWLQHFQSAVLHDYLPRIVDRSSFRSVMQHGRCIVKAGASSQNPDWLPIEFGAAVARFGHSMIRDAYRPWNRIEGLARLSEFMESSYANSGDKLSSSAHRLLRNWVTNWFLLLDFSGTAYDALAIEPIKASKINLSLSPALASLPSCLFDELCSNPAPGDVFALAEETMKTGHELGLATAQHAVFLTNAALASKQQPPLAYLLPEQIPTDDPSVRQAFTEHPDLLTRTPLWYYILREAEHFCGGCHLGPLGSRIVMETVHAAIESSANSILSQPAWRPQLPSANLRHFSMPDLIAMAGHPNPIG